MKVEPWLRIIAGTAALLGLFGVLLATLYRYDLRVDLTAGQRHVLSPHASQLLANLTADVETVFARQHYVKQDQIVRLLTGSLTGALSVANYFDIVAL